MEQVTYALVKNIGIYINPFNPRHLCARVGVSLGAERICDLEDRSRSRLRRTDRTALPKWLGRAGRTAPTVQRAKQSAP
jgi:hypothetical protein